MTRHSIWALAALCALPCLAAEKLTVRDGFPFVDVLVNGQGPFRMLIDTGATASLLTPAAAKQAHLEPDHRMILTTFAGERTVPGVSRNQIQLGRWMEAGLPILVVDLPEIRRLDSKADGVLGQSFFSRVPFLLDYRQKLLWLGEEATAQAARLPLAVTAERTHGRMVLPVTLEPGGPVVQLTLDSGATNLVVDCGERCPRIFGGQTEGALITHAGERRVTRGLLRDVEIAGRRMPPADTVMLDDVEEDRWDDGLLPARWFEAFYVSGRDVRFTPAR